MPYTENPSLGKFEGNYSQWLAEVLYAGPALNDEWSPPHDGYVDWYGLIDGRRHSWIVHEDNDGFYSYTEYSNKDEANNAWASLVQNLEKEYEECAQ